MVREGMRGEDKQQNHIFSYLSPEARVRKDHPLRAIRTMMDEVLSQLSRRFVRIQANKAAKQKVVVHLFPQQSLAANRVQHLAQPPPQQFLRGHGRAAYRGIHVIEEVWGATTFTKNRDRFLAADVAKEFPVRVVQPARH